MKKNITLSPSLSNFLSRISFLLNLRSDMDEKNTIATIRENVNFRSANAWTLVFAIFIASIGLNTNSAAVIIGAMLISPLMGPILGIGLSLGINDFELLKRSALNLSYAVGISLVTSTCYFLISPLNEIQSELLARTQPTFYDVLIALFGGAAGIVAISRREKGNAIPGVAIATALMPPLCTAGFGLAGGNLSYFIGAFYLFIINCVFISLSTYFFVRYMNFEKISFTNTEQDKNIKKIIATISFVVILPSLVLAYFLQQETSFKSRAQSFIKNEIKFDRSFVVDKDITYSFSEEKIIVNLVGESLRENEIAILKERMHKYGLKPQCLELRQASLEENLEKKMSEKFSAESNMIRDYQLKLSQTEAELKNFEESQVLTLQITKESQVLFKNIKRVIIYTDKNSTANSEKERAQIAIVIWKSSPNKSDANKMTAFLKERALLTDQSVTQVREL